MQAVKNRPPVIRRGGIVYLGVDEIKPNPVQPRRDFEPEALEELSRSITSYGILNPLTVRLRGSEYELVAGERRLRAARLAGMREVPCTLLDINLEDAGLIALIENLQRRDLSYIEEAMGLKSLITLFGMSQEEAARRIGKSQSAVANKLRLLKLPHDVLDALRENNLSERHGRALLRLPDAPAQRSALKFIIENSLNVASAEEYIEELLKPVNGEARHTLVMKDVKLFLNSICHSLEVMNQGGIAADMQREETDDSLILRISILKGGR